MLEQYSISDVLTWLDDKTLVLNANFQRRSVWPAAAKSYLIDTVLRGRSMPKIYLRTRTDAASKRSFREVVDGQQRLRTIQEFANDEFAIGSQKIIYGDFAGKKYGQLSTESKEQYLSYLLSVEQLFNATDEEVLDTFQRLNAYGLDLNQQELRHGKWQGAFRNAVVESSRQWSLLWEKYRVVGLRARVRMADDELMAQMFGTVLEGVVDGGQPTINRLYRDYDDSLPAKTPAQVGRVIKYIVSELDEILDTGLNGAPHFLMLFAAVAHALIGIPTGQIGKGMPARDGKALSDLDVARANLGRLADVLPLEAEAVPKRFQAFKLASAGTTQRIRSRKPRFLMLYKALLPKAL